MTLSEVEPSDSGLLDVGDGQTIYWETIGNRSGTPAIFLHGGPGSGAGPSVRPFFDHETFRAVLFDQRGCGRSRPLARDADLSSNTTWHLIEDIERLREHLRIEHWLVVGVSWGVTLALVYAQRYPQRVNAMVLGAVTSGTRAETEWITRDMGRVFPREWDDFVAIVAVAERDGDLAAAYARLLASDDPGVREEAARRWCHWEETHVSLVPGWTPSPRYQDPEFRLNFALLVTHYWGHGCFLKPGQVMAQMDKLATTPAVLIHGRYDVSSPLDTAWKLHKSWPASRLVVLDDAGHGGGSFNSELIAAIDSFR